jgi:hypothetical protein
MASTGVWSCGHSAPAPYFFSFPLRFPNSSSYLRRSVCTYPRRSPSHLSTFIIIP